MFLFNRSFIYILITGLVKLSYAIYIDDEVGKEYANNFRLKRQIALPERHTLEPLLLLNPAVGLEEGLTGEIKYMWIERAEEQCHTSKEKRVIVECIRCVCPDIKISCELLTRDCRLAVPQSLLNRPLFPIIPQWLNETIKQTNQNNHQNNFNQVDPNYNQNKQNQMNPKLYQYSPNYQTPRPYYQAASNGQYNQANYMQNYNNYQNRRPVQNYPANNQGLYQNYNIPNTPLRDNRNVNSVTVDPNQIVDYYKQLYLNGTFGKIDEKNKQITDTKYPTKANSTVTYESTQDQIKNNQSKTVQNVTNESIPNKTLDGTNYNLEITKTANDTNTRKKIESKIRRSNFRRSLLRFNYSKISEVDKIRLTKNLKRFSLLDLLKGLTIRTHVVKKMMIRAANMIKNITMESNQNVTKSNKTHLDPSIKAVLDYDFSDHGKLNESKLINDIRSFSISDLIYGMRVRMHTVRKFIRRMEMILTSDWNDKQNDTENPDQNITSTNNQTHVDFRRTEKKSEPGKYIGDKLVFCETNCVKRCNLFYGRNETSYCKNDRCYCF